MIVQSWVGDFSDGHEWRKFTFFWQASRCVCGKRGYTGKLMRKEAWYCTDISMMQFKLTWVVVIWQRTWTMPRTNARAQRARNFWSACEGRFARAASQEHADEINYADDGFYCSSKVLCYLCRYQIVGVVSGSRRCWKKGRRWLGSRYASPEYRC